MVAAAVMWLTLLAANTATSGVLAIVTVLSVAGADALSLAVQWFGKATPAARCS